MASFGSQFGNTVSVMVGKTWEPELVQWCLNLEAEKGESWSLFCFLASFYSPRTPAHNNHSEWISLFPVI